MFRPCVFSLLALTAVGCATATKTDVTGDMTQRQQAASLNAQLGSDYFRQGNWEEAKSKLDRALDQDSKNTQANIWAGMLYDRLGEADKAESYLQRAVSLDARNAEAQNTLAVFLCSHGKFEAGEKHALAAAAEGMYKTPEVAFLNAGKCALGQRNLERANKHFRRALDIQPRFGAALFEMADMEYRAGQFLIARAFLERFSATARATSASLLLAVQIETALGNKSLAADYARRLRQEFTTSDEVKQLIEIEPAGR